MSKYSKPLLAVFFFSLIIHYSPIKAQVVIDPYSPDSRLYQCMDKAYVNQLSSDKSALILYYNYYLDHSFYVVSLKKEKPVTGIDIHTVTLNTSGTAVETFSEKTYSASAFNVLKYNFNRDLNGFITYVWQEAGIALVFIPQRHFQAQFADYSKSIKNSR